MPIGFYRIDRPPYLVCNSAMPRKRKKDAVSRLKNVRLEPILESADISVNPTTGVVRIPRLLFQKALDKLLFEKAAARKRRRHK
jgi:hypothetical protein